MIIAGYIQQSKPNAVQVGTKPAQKLHFKWTERKYIARITTTPLCHRTYTQILFSFALKWVFNFSGALSSYIDFMKFILKTITKNYPFYSQKYLLSISLNIS